MLQALTNNENKKRKAIQDICMYEAIKIYIENI